MSTTELKSDDKLVIKGHATAMVIVQEKILLLFFNNAFQVTNLPLDGKTVKFATDYGTPSAACSLDKWVFITTDKGIYKLNNGKGTIERINIEDWSGCKGLFGHDQNLYAVCSKIHKIDPNTGYYKAHHSSTGWDDTNTAVQVNNHLYVPMNETGELWRVNLDEKDKADVVATEWGTILSACASTDGKKLYLNDGAIWGFDVEAENHKQLTEKGWLYSGPSVYLNDKVYTSTSSGFWESNLTTAEEKKLDLGWELTEPSEDKDLMAE